MSLQVKLVFSREVRFRHEQGSTESLEKEECWSDSARAGTFVSALVVAVVRLMLHLALLPILIDIIQTCGFNFGATRKR